MDHKHDIRVNLNPLNLIRLLSIQIHLFAIHKFVKNIQINQVSAEKLTML